MDRGQARTESYLQETGVEFAVHLSVQQSKDGGAAAVFVHDQLHLVSQHRRAIGRIVHKLLHPLRLLLLLLLCMLIAVTVTAAAAGAGTATGQGGNGTAGQG